MNRSVAGPWLERALALLDDSAASMDAVTRLHLAQARHEALAQRPGRHRGWAIGSGLAGVALALLLVAGIGHRHEAALAPEVHVHGGEADANGGDVDATDLVENLDFYVWLDAEQQGRDD